LALAKNDLLRHSRIENLGSLGTFAHQFLA
jgi:hypothetical protein